ncbi:hypothetical protein [Paenibacillus crassostreae]|uniref:Uncharacterized protein n=1 Tax=Paenibacillus crassostreae TaxID=1763538 RepID=A0A167C786_9BACL|nr:hypothetical protein [Paenibacillus crassostreae]AOZ91558.1 hypothetical protein LPB68_04570 [Paenibacillus crassostreae]OAB72868.1 hypothetical protein PNBC_15680 [Paenibacillus crassostreae]
MDYNLDENLKQAYKRLDLPEDISKEELNKRFDLLLKRQRSIGTDGTTYDDEFQAYKLILDALDQQEIQAEEDQRLAKWGRLSGIARKFENFLLLYKIHTIITIVVLIVLVVGGNALYKNWQEQKYLASLPPVDASIMFLGNYESQDTGKMDDLNEMIVTHYPEWKRVETSIVYLPSTDGTANTMDMSYLQRALAVLASDRPDIIFMDEGAMDWINQQDALQSLESIVSAKDLSEDDLRLIRSKNENGQQEIVGLDISDTSFASDLPINYAAPTFIAGILTSNEKRDEAMEFFEHIIE